MNLEHHHWTLAYVVVLIDIVAKALCECEYHVEYRRQRNHR